MMCHRQENPNYLQSVLENGLCSSHSLPACNQCKQSICWFVRSRVVGSFFSFDGGIWDASFLVRVAPLSSFNDSLINVYLYRCIYGNSMVMDTLYTIEWSGMKSRHAATSNNTSIPHHDDDPSLPHTSGEWRRPGEVGRTVTS